MGRLKIVEKLTAKCVTCGHDFLYNPASQRGLYCSNKCRQNRVYKICGNCGCEFSVRASKENKYTYCSMICRKHAIEQTKIDKACRYCGKNYTCIPSRSDSIFCCDYCYRQYNIEKSRTEINCLYCGKKRQVKTYRLKESEHSARFCNNSCHSRYMLESMGGAPGYIRNKIKSGYRTDIEGLVESVLINHGITYEFEKKVGRYWADFALTRYAIIIECDGHYHDTEKGMTRDKVKQRALELAGWHVIHLHHSEIKKDPTNCVLNALSGFIG